MIYELAKRKDRDNAVAKFKKAMDNEKLRIFFGDLYNYHYLN